MQLTFLKLFNSNLILFMKYLLLALQLVALPLVTTGNIKYTSISKNTEISYTGAYTTLIELKGKSSDENILPLYFSALEKISITEVKTSLSSDKWIRQKKKEHKIEDAPSNSFYSGAQMIRIDIPKNSEFSITYTLTCTELKMLSRMYFNNYYEIDSIRYQFKVPSIFQLKFDTTELLKLDIDIDSISIPYQQLYTFCADHQEKIDKCQKTLLFSISNKNENQYTSLVNWYRKLLKEIEGIGDLEISEITTGINANDTLRFINDVFNKVRQKISYIDFEAGYGAWQPRPANQIIQNKKGDCKDMANVLYQIFKRNKISAHIALIASTSKTDFTFPTLASFNHAICIVRFQGREYVLDATDKTSPLGFPSRHTQGHTALCISDSTYWFYKIPTPKNDLNINFNTIKITETDSGNFGTWNCTFRGYEASKFNDLIIMISAAESNRELQKYFASTSSKINISKLEIMHNSLDSISFLIHFKLEGGLYFQSKETKYIHIKNLPLFHPPVSNEGSCHYYFDYLVNSTTTIQLEFKSPLQTSKNPPTEIRNDIAHFTTSIRQIDNNKIEFKNKFEITKLELNEKENSQHNEFQNKVQAILTSTITL